MFAAFVRDAPASEISDSYSQLSERQSGVLVLSYFRVTFAFRSVSELFVRNCTCD